MGAPPWPTRAPARDDMAEENVEKGGVGARSRRCSSQAITDIIRGWQLSCVQGRAAIVIQSGRALRLRGIYAIHRVQVHFAAPSPPIGRRISLRVWGLRSLVGRAQGRHSRWAFRPFYAVARFSGAAWAERGRGIATACLIPDSSAAARSEGPPGGNSNGV